MKRPHFFRSTRKSAPGVEHTGDISSIRASDFMTRKLVTVSPHMDVLEAIQVLVKNCISGAPVVDDSGRLMGIFSEKCSMHVILDAAYDQLPTNEVAAFMDVDSKTISADTDLLTIAQVFLLTTFRRLPVVDDEGKLLGQVSRRDVLSIAMSAIDAPPQREANSLLYLSALLERSEAPVV